MSSSHDEPNAMTVTAIMPPNPAGYVSEIKFSRPPLPDPGPQMSMERIAEEKAKKMAAQIGSHHLGIVIDGVVSAVLGVFKLATGKTPEFQVRQLENTNRFGSSSTCTLVSRYRQLGWKELKI